MPIVGFGTAGIDDMDTTIDTALEAGFRHIDTAYVYKTEEAIGKSLKRWFDSGKIKREELFIVTKLPSQGNRAEDVEKYLKQSLENLQMTYVDLYLIHQPVGKLPELDNDGKRAVDPNTDHLIARVRHCTGSKRITTTLNLTYFINVYFLQRMPWRPRSTSGRARSIGLSNFNARQVKRVWENARIKPANNQVELNVFFQRKELVAFCKALDVTICAYSPLGAPGMRTKMHKGDPSLIDMPITNPVVLKLAEKYKKTPSQILIRHSIQRGVVVFDFVLSPEDVYELDFLDRGEKGRAVGPHGPMSKRTPGSTTVLGCIGSPVDPPVRPPLEKNPADTLAPTIGLP
ncbi:unnamed protein product [Timema podura]|uniref:NADP-dependent oxidoreductase domain-containing protein n=1 Tax=Timema podura TaxID=61482 RepID=A0ABN7P073_TIMPD|nr:unnamed protein product [Timema podura]